MIRCAADGLRHPVINSVVCDLEGLTVNAFAFEKPGIACFPVYHKHPTSNKLVADFSCLLSAPIGLCRTQTCKIDKRFSEMKVHAGPLPPSRVRCCCGSISLLDSSFPSVFDPGFGMDQFAIHGLEQIEMG